LFYPTKKGIFNLQILEGDVQNPEKGHLAISAWCHCLFFELSKVGKLETGLEQLGCDKVISWIGI
jgi:hypothetical protein